MKGGTWQNRAVNNDDTSSAELTPTPKQKQYRSKKGSSSQPVKGEWNIDNTYQRLLIRRVGIFPRTFDIFAARRPGTPADQIAHARLSLGRPCKRVVFYDSKSSRQPLFQFQARVPYLTKATYDVIDLKDGKIGSFKKDFGKSFANANFLLETDYFRATGKDSQTMINVLRRAVDYNGEVDFLFILENTRRVLHVTRGWKADDPYLVEMPKLSDGRQLDWRMGAAIGCALDSLLNRQI